jgi:threonine/homoserine/homoserine lactone efflux protein
MGNALGIHDFAVFLLSAVTLAVIPEQDTLYVLGRTLAQGRGAGFASIAGILSGAIVHLLAGALGLSALLGVTPHGFVILRWAGGSYLIYLGIQSLRSGNESPSETAIPFEQHNHFIAWRQGMLTNLLNPKVALFILAFIPQFIHPDSAHKALAFVFLGSCFFVVGSLWLLCLVWFADWIGGKLGKDRPMVKVLNVLAGGLFIALGVRLLMGNSF